MVTIFSRLYITPYALTRLAYVASYFNAGASAEEATFGTSPADGSLPKCILYTLLYYNYTMFCVYCKFCVFWQR